MTPKKTDHAALAAEIRRYALAFPETREDRPWGETAIKVKTKAFVFMRCDEEGLSIGIKLPQSNRAALKHPFCEPTHYVLGKHGWVTASFGPKADVPMDLLKKWIEESFRAVAPKTLVKQMDAGPVRAKKTSKKGEKR